MSSMHPEEPNKEAEMGKLRIVKLDDLKDRDGPVALRVPDAGRLSKQLYSVANRKLEDTGGEIQVPQVNGFR